MPYGQSPTDARGHGCWRCLEGKYYRSGLGLKYNFVINLYSYLL